MNLTSGLTLVFYLLEQNVSSIGMFGFDFFNKSFKYHFWDEFITGNSNNHNNLQEQNIVNSLLESKKIILY